MVPLNKNHNRSLSQFHNAVAKWDFTFNNDRRTVAIMNLRLIDYGVSQCPVDPEPEGLQILRDFQIPHDAEAQKWAEIIFGLLTTDSTLS